MFNISDSENDADNKYYKLISRCIASRDERVSSIIIKQFPEVLAHFVGALTKVMPSIDSNSAHLKIMFMAGALAHSLFHYENLLLISEGRFDVEQTIFCTKQGSIYSLLGKIVTESSCAFTPGLDNY